MAAEKVAPQLVSQQGQLREEGPDQWRDEVSENSSAGRLGLLL
jgi:hypothetical protein